MSTLTASNGVKFAFTAKASPVKDASRAELLADPDFGRVFTDHMVRISWSAKEGWHDRRVVPYGPLTLDPAAAVLHYGQEIFEGVKAYRHLDDSIWTFRPQANAARFQRSAHRLSLPELSEADFVASLEVLIAVDGAWVPGSEGERSLYLRPFMIATEAFLGVHSAGEVEYLVIASPVGPYFAGGVNPVSIWVEKNYHRAGPGGTGAAKCGGNYAAALLPQDIGAEHGCAQVAFLDAKTDSYFDELGGMNMYVVMNDGRVVTPELNGNILEGVTRSSLIELARERGHAVEERPLSLDEVLDGIRSGKVAEIFACGTAAVIAPMGRLKGEGFDVTVADGQAGQLTLELRKALTDIQYGRSADTHGWTHRLA